MTTDIYAQVLISDGEALDAVDLTGLGARTLAVLYDQIIRAIIPRDPNILITDVNDPTTYPYALAPTALAGMPQIGSANNKVLIGEGTLFQAIGAATGAEPQLLGFHFDGTTEVTIANGDATNPRVDLVQMKLEYVNDTPTARNFQDAVTRALTSTTPNIRRRVKCTLSVKQGAPAASPTYPEADAGNVIIAGVVVGASYAAGSGFVSDDTAGAVAVLHDQRLPFNVRPRVSMPGDYIYPTVGASWQTGNTYDNNARSHVLQIADTSATGDSLNIPCLFEGVCGRLTSIASDSLDHSAAFVTSISRGRWVTGGASNAVTYTALANPDINGSGIGLFKRRSTGQFGFQATHTPAAGPIVQSNSNGVGPPIWTNGRRRPGDPDDNMDMVFLRYTTSRSGSTFGPTTFFIAEGL